MFLFLKLGLVSTQFVDNDSFENSWKKIVTKKTVTKVIGKLSEKSKSILSPQKKKTSPKTLKLQEAKTAKFTIELICDSIAEGTYSNPERQKMKREQLHEKKPKRKARWERENQI